MKSALTFFSGSLFSAGVVFISPSKPAILLLMGAALALATMATLVWFIGIPRTIRILDSLTDGQNLRAPGSPKNAMVKRFDQIDRSGYVRPSRKQEAQILKDTVLEYTDNDDIFGPSEHKAS